jgi:chromosome segregation ATPase
MKVKVTIVLLIIVCLLLGVALLYRHGSAVEQHKKDTATILDFSNQVVEVTGKLRAQEQVNAMLETNLAARIEEVVEYSNRLTKVTAQLSKVQADAVAAAKAAADEIARRDQKISALESERDELDKKLIGLTTRITSLDSKIAETERKLAASEGDREFLLGELKRLQNEKADLERQFNDLAVLREQVKKLKDELSIARRLDWIRRGLYGDVKKGGELLQQGIVAIPARTNYSLNVELSPEGARVVTPPVQAPPAPAPK